jgi:hypothetical protein
MGEYGRLAMSVPVAAGALVAGRVHHPTAYVGARLTFADGTSSRVYRETVIDVGDVRDPAVLLVAFRLRLVRGRRGHAAFRLESWLNTILFVGFRGFVSKLWCAHDENHTYRGLYQWDGADRAEEYVGSLRHVLAIVSHPLSIDHVVLPDLRREDFLGGGRTVAGADDWWRVLATAPRPMSR